ncbi:MAG TPA: carboxylating nicotinate-nucleotide diphosphorylase [Blastocatellia bacterium]|nr:carboxylating nicotinate-nucleotide diphosphorylase [Blastocatellia bacterium]
MIETQVRLLDFITEAGLRRLVERALEEDVGRGDVTSDSLIPLSTQSKAVFRSRVPGVIAGLDVAKMVFDVTDSRVRFENLIEDGVVVVPHQELAVVSGPARSVLRGERVALNFLQRLSGVATLTSKYVEAVRGTRARIVDTRKTTPGLRSLEKYAVRAGGGFNHRRDLGDAVLIKDNHLAVIRALGLSAAEAIEKMRLSLPHTVKIEIEVDRIDQLGEVLKARPEIILLDNMSTADLTKAAGLINGRATTEASGGVSLEKVGDIAASGVDLISVGAITHSAPALDISLDFEQI